MGVLRVIDPGMLSTVQDLGRPGHTALGVPPGGAADSLSLRLGNRLVGNHDGAAAIEMTMTGGTFLFDDDAAVVLAGGVVTASIESPAGPPRVIRPLSPAVIRAGERLHTGSVTRGARTYLCIAGGIDVPLTLGSASTHLAASFGGLDGRALHAGDQLRFGVAASPPIADSRSDHARVITEERLTLRTFRVLAGPHLDQFDPPARAAFWKSTFTVSPHSDRMGVRLQGDPIPSRAGGRMPSEGMPTGAIQVPDDGQPIALMVDRPTTGGYPVIACIATVDLPALGQLRPREVIRFQPVALAHARDLFDQQQRRLNEQVPTP